MFFDSKCEAIIPPLYKMFLCPLPVKKKFLKSKYHFTFAYSKYFQNFFSDPSTATGSDEGVISLDLSRDVLEDTFAEMSNTPIPPDLIM